MAENDNDESIWEMLQLDEDEDSLKYSDIEEEVEHDLERSDKMERKLSAKMDDMQKKFERTILRERISKFEETADDLQKDLFRTIAADVKDPESFDKAVSSIDKLASQMREKEAVYQKQMEEEAAARVASAWGTGPLGTPTAKPADWQEENLKKIAMGDTHALFEDLMDGNWPVR